MLERANNKPILFHREFRHSITRRGARLSPGIYRTGEHSDAAVTRRTALRPPRGLSLSLLFLSLSPSPSSHRKPMREVHEIETRANFPGRRESRDRFSIEVSKDS